MSAKPTGPWPTFPDTELAAHLAAAAPVNQPMIIADEQLQLLRRRSNGKGAVRLAMHGFTIVLSGTIYGWLAIKMPTGSRWSSYLLAFPWMALLGFSFASMFACMHECLHRTAFRSSVVNDAVAWFAGLLAFYNSALFRHSHGWHHRYTQVPGMDPELDMPKPSSMREYWLEISGFLWWRDKLREERDIMLGDLSAHRYLPARVRSEVVRSGRIQLLVYMLLILGSLLLMARGVVHVPLFVAFWLLPLIVGQPVLRVILLADHTACTLNTNALTNTRTTYTLALIRFLMWEMPFHAEHHRYPGIPFHALAKVHTHLKPHLGHIATDGFIGAQRVITSTFPRTTK